MAKRKTWAPEGPPYAQIIHGGPNRNPVTLCIDSGSRRIHYRYWVGIGSPDVVECDFSLLCEVGEPWQPYFADIISRENLQIEAFDSGKDYYERIKE